MHMLQRNIPWQEHEKWKQLRLSFQSFSQIEKLPDQVESLTASITEKLESVNDTLVHLCCQTCRSCQNNCCARATVWYDFRDLVYLFCSQGFIPDQQITKKKDLTCVHLSSSGCTLARSKRPFICTWYLCSAHKSLLKKNQRYKKGIAVEVEKILNNIKDERKSLEKTFLDCIVGKSQ